jgi:L-asparaginase
MQSTASPFVVLLGTGGTIAGASSDADDDIGYVAGQLSAAQLVAALPALAEVPLQIEQLAQIDSKDMSVELWRALAAAVERHLARPEVGGIVITHGTDTLEETAYFLQRVLAPAKPVVLVGAMRPATSSQADGPQNLLDAIVVACSPGARGVVAVLAGTVHSAFDVRKCHTSRPEAFGSGDAGPLGVVEQGQLAMRRAWPQGRALGLAWLPESGAGWPQVEIVTSHAGAGRAMVDAACRSGAQGIVVAGTGNGTLHRALEEALVDAQAAGVSVLRSSRCLNGSVVDAAGPTFRSAGALTPVQARIELTLQLLGAAAR